MVTGARRNDMNGHASVMIGDQPAHAAATLAPAFRVATPSLMTGRRAVHVTHRRFGYRLSAARDHAPPLRAGICYLAGGPLCCADVVPMLRRCCVVAVLLPCCCCVVVLKLSCCGLSWAVMPGCSAGERCGRVLYQTELHQTVLYQTVLRQTVYRQSRSRHLAQLLRHSGSTFSARLSARLSARPFAQLSAQSGPHTNDSAGHGIIVMPGYLRLQQR